MKRFILRHALELMAGLLMLSVLFGIAKTFRVAELQANTAQCPPLQFGHK